MQAGEVGGRGEGELRLEHLPEERVDAVSGPLPRATAPRRRSPAPAPARIRALFGRPDSRLTSSGHSSAVTLIRIRKRRTEAGWLASTSAKRYWATLPSSWASEVTSCCGSVPCFSGATARRRPTAHPSACSQSAWATGADTRTPAARNKLRVSSGVNARSAARISAIEPSSRYWCRGRPGSQRPTITRCSRRPALRRSRSSAVRIGPVGQVVGLIEDQDDGPRLRVGEHGHRDAREDRRVQRLTRHRPGHGVDVDPGTRQRHEHVGPESGRVVVVDVEGDPAHRCSRRLRADPRCGKGRLPRPGGSAQQREGAVLGGAREQADQPGAQHRHGRHGRRDELAGEKGNVVRGAVLGHPVEDGWTAHDIELRVHGSSVVRAGNRPGTGEPWPSRVFDSCSASVAGRSLREQGTSALSARVPVRTLVRRPAAAVAPCTPDEESTAGWVDAVGPEGAEGGHDAGTAAVVRRGGPRDAGPGRWTPSWRPSRPAARRRYAGLVTARAAIDVVPLARLLRAVHARRWPPPRRGRPRRRCGRRIRLSALADVVLPWLAREVLSRLDVVALVREFVDVDRIAAGLDVDAVAARLDLDAVIERIDIEGIAAGLDLDALVEKVDVSRVIDRVDLDEVVGRVDLDKAVASVDLDRIVDRVDVDRVVNRVDLDRIIDRVDVDRVAARLDLDPVIERANVVAIARYVIDAIDLPRLIRSSTASMTAETVRGVRDQGVDADRAVERLVDRLLLRRQGRHDGDAEVRG